jgi:2-polyprenyl-3-methyl-5-hydroxy-6-metoxy-1,4-benzoquinol methylase
MFGLQLQRLPKTRPPLRTEQKPQTAQKPGARKYYNTGLLTPLEENSMALNDAFYSDQQALEHLYQGTQMDLYRAVVDQCIHQHLALNDKAILDVGCGVAYLLSSIRQAFSPRSLAGCDFSRQAVERSRESFPEMQFFQHDIYDPIPRKYDVVFCTEVLEHLERPFIALANLANALLPGGVLVITVPNGRKDAGIEHLNFWSPESWRVFLERECPAAQVSNTTIVDGRWNFAVVRFPPV